MNLDLPITAVERPRVRTCGASIELVIETVDHRGRRSRRKPVRVTCTRPHGHASHGQHVDAWHRGAKGRDSYDWRDSDQRLVVRK